MKFETETDALFALYNGKYCQYHEANTSFELAGAGRTRVQVVSALPCFHIPDLDSTETWNFSENNKEKSWFPFMKKVEMRDWKKGKEVIKENQDCFRKCADHAVFLYDDAQKRWILHLFEMKTGMGRRTGDKVLWQLNGALFRAFAIGSVVLRNQGFLQIYTHMVYRPKEYSQAVSEPAELRAGIDERIEGAGQDTDGKDADSGTPLWDQPTLELPSYPLIPVTNQAVRLDKFGKSDVRLDKGGCTRSPSDDT